MEPAATAPYPPPASPSHEEIHPKPNNDADGEADQAAAAVGGAAVPLGKRRGRGIIRSLSISNLMGRLRSRKSRTNSPAHTNGVDSSSEGFAGSETTSAITSPSQASDGGMSRYDSAVSLAELEHTKRMSRHSSATDLQELEKKSMSKYTSDSKPWELDQKSSMRRSASTANLAELDKDDGDDGGDIDAKADVFIAHFYEQMRLQKYDKRSHGENRG